MAVEGHVVAAHEEEDVVVPAFAELAVPVLWLRTIQSMTRRRKALSLCCSHAQGGTPSGTRSGENETGGVTARP